MNTDYHRVAMRPGDSLDVKERIAVMRRLDPCISVFIRGKKLYG